MATGGQLRKEAWKNWWWNYHMCMEASLSSSIFRAHMPPTLERASSFANHYFSGENQVLWSKLLKAKIGPVLWQWPLEGNLEKRREKGDIYIYIRYTHFIYEYIHFTAHVPRRCCPRFHVDGGLGVVPRLPNPASDAAGCHSHPRGPVKI